MPSITLYPALVEHPFGDPATNTFIQWHSYIFPGDEILLFHNIALPDMAGAATMNDVKIVSAKVSVLAVKPQVFSRVFSEQFKSTREFELDSFITTFNKLNAPYVPWFSDGYAQDVHFSQERNFRLPIGDLRREINFFTQHIDGDSIWTYRFYFPILFRWEYWLSKVNVSNDFLDFSLPQNGQNEFWQRYFVFGKWKIVSRLELTVLVDGVQKIITSELSLSRYFQSINNYNSNIDWTNKSIKTCAIGGTPSNSPAFIYGNKDTAVFAYFTKASGYSPLEQGKISAVIWIEPTLGDGVTARARASSSYPVGDESVFYSLDTSVTDDSGTGITDDSGDYIITSPGGKGVEILFDADPRKITFLSIIDPLKLAAVFPGETNFTLYARLYNSDLITSGSMAEAPQGQTKRGEEIKQDFVLVAPQTDSSLCDSIKPQCPFNLEVFADLSDADVDKNDKNDFYEYGLQFYHTAVTLTLQKNNDLCNEDWSDVAVISDNSYGKFFAYGKSNDFLNNDFLDDYNKKYTGVFLEWRKVLDAFGVGNYRMKIEKTTALGPVETFYDDRTFCLRAYNCNLVNGTVKIETLNKGLRGSQDNYVIQTDFAGGWKGEIRLKGLFTLDNEPDSVREFNQMGDNQYNRYEAYINELVPKYNLSIKPVPGWVDYSLMNRICLSNQIAITDYNKINPHTLRKTPVYDGVFKSKRSTFINPLAQCVITFKHGNNNLRVRNS